MKSIIKTTIFAACLALLPRTLNSRQKIKLKNSTGDTLTCTVQWTTHSDKTIATTFNTSLDYKISPNDSLFTNVPTDDHRILDIFCLDHAGNGYRQRYGVAESTYDYDYVNSAWGASWRAGNSGCVYAKITPDPEPNPDPKVKVRYGVITFESTTGGGDPKLVQFPTFPGIESEKCTPNTAGIYYSPGLFSQQSWKPFWQLSDEKPAPIPDGCSSTKNTVVSITNSGTGRRISCKIYKDGTLKGTLSNIADNAGKSITFTGEQLTGLSITCSDGNKKYELDDNTDKKTVTQRYEPIYRYSIVFARSACP